MAFLLKTDILKEIRSEELAQITRSDDTIINYSIDVSISEMKSYLTSHYDVNSIFAETGSNRHALLLNFGVDIAIYIMVSTALPGQDLEDRRARYKRAIDWLKQLSEGKVATDLPKLATTDTPNSRGSVGEHNKRNNYY
jgi:phage gp36-like protein